MTPNVLDLALGGILAFSVLAAFRNGITREAIRITAVFFGVLAAVWWCDAVGRALHLWIADGRVAAGAAFLSIFLGCLIAGALLSRVLNGVWRWTGLRWFDRGLGAAFGLVRGLLLAALLVLVLLVSEPLAGSSRIVADSKVASWILQVAWAAASIAFETG